MNFFCFIYPTVRWEEKKKCWKEGPRNKMRYSKSTQNETGKPNAWARTPKLLPVQVGWVALEVLCTFSACKVGYTTQISALKRQELQHGSSPWCNTASQWQTERGGLSNPCAGIVQSNSSGFLHFAIIELLTVTSHKMSAWNDKATWPHWAVCI